MSEDVLAYVESKGLKPRRAGGHEVHFPCPFHDESEGDRGRLYLNTDPYASIPGLFTCFVCGESGSLVKLKRFYGDEVHRQEDSERSHEQLRVLAEASRYYQEQLGEHPDVVRWLRSPERMLEVETIVQAGLGYSPPDNGKDRLYRHLRGLDCKTADIMATGLVAEDRNTGKLHDSLIGMVTIPYMVAGHCVTIRGRKWPMGEGDHKYKTLAGQAARVYRSESCWGANEIVLAEGELDALVLAQLGIPAIGVPGATVWQDSWGAYVEGMHRIWILFDPDEAGDKGAEKLIEKLGPKARRVRLPCDVTDWVAREHTASELRDIMAEAGRSRYLVTVTEARKEHADLQGVEGLKFDFAGLDFYMEPGLRPGQVAIPLASTGVGKTILLENMLQRAASRPGQEHLKFLFVSLEQTRAEWWERARRIFRFYNLDATDEQADKFWASRLMLVDRNRLNPVELEATLDDFEYEMGQPPDLVCLDYLGYWAQSFKGERYERMTDAVMTLKGIAKDRRVPFVVPHQVSRGVVYGEEPDISSARDAGTIEETADFLLSLWRPDVQKAKREEEKTGTVMLRLKKSRHGNVGKTQEFVFAPFSLTLVPWHDKRYPEAELMAKAEVRWDRDRDTQTWEQAVARHRKGEL